MHAEEVHGGPALAGCQSPLRCCQLHHCNTKLVLPAAWQGMPSNLMGLFDVVNRLMVYAGVRLHLSRLSRQQEWSLEDGQTGRGKERQGRN
jgi:hypothetical protein